jgi:hypothetical protein
MGSFRRLFPRVAARRAWSPDGEPVWEFRITPRGVDPADQRLAPPVIEDRRPPVRFVSSRGVEIGGDTLRIDQFHYRLRKPFDRPAVEVEGLEVAGVLVALAADPESEAALHRLVARLGLEHAWFASAAQLEISAARIAGDGLARSLDGIFVWRADAGRTLTYLVVPHPRTKDLLAADPDLLRALLRAACPAPDAVLGDLEGNLREAITRLGVAADPIHGRGPVTRSTPTGLVLAVDPQLDPGIPAEPPADRPKSASERALSEELAELARRVGTASVRAPDRPSKAG